MDDNKQNELYQNIRSLINYYMETEEYEPLSDELKDNVFRDIEDNEYVELNDFNSAYNHVIRFYQDDHIKEVYSIEEGIGSEYAKIDDDFESKRVDIGNINNDTMVRKRLIQDNHPINVNIQSVSTDFKKKFSFNNDLVIKKEDIVNYSTDDMDRDIEKKTNLLQKFFSKRYLSDMEIGNGNNKKKIAARFTTSEFTKALLSISSDWDARPLDINFFPTPNGMRIILIVKITDKRLNRSISVPITEPVIVEKEMEVGKKKLIPNYEKTVEKAFSKGVRNGVKYLFPCEAIGLELRERLYGIPKPDIKRFNK